MLSFREFDKDYKMRGPLQSFVEMENFVNPQHEITGNRAEIVENRLQYAQIQNTYNWILKLGGSHKCAQQLSIAFCDHPGFSLYHFQNRWEYLAQRMGSNQLDLVDEMILREIRELLLDHPSAVNNPKRSSSQSNVTWYSNYDRMITSTPLRQKAVEGKLDDYNLDKDPSNIDIHISHKQHHDFEKGSSNRNTGDYRNVHGYCREDEIQYPQQLNRYENDPINYNEMSNYTKEVEYCQTDQFNIQNTKNTDVKSRRTLRSPNSLNVDNHPSRKRIADRADESQMKRKKRRRHMNRSRRFGIGAFKMPYVKDRACPLPQPERKSYAIAFFKRKHCFIIGGNNTIRVDANKFSTQGMFNVGRNYCKHMRRSIQKKWNNDIMDHYDDWSNWWQDHKWCGNAIIVKLDKYRGVNVLQKTLLNLNFKKPSSVQRLLKLAQMALQKDINNFHSILNTILEIQNWKFLQKLTIDDFGKLQDSIRYVPNKLWLNIMRGMVFLWRNYYEIHTNSSLENTEMRYATSAQWHSYLFHWLTKEAFDELKRISQNEWSLHKTVFPIS